MDREDLIELINLENKQLLECNLFEYKGFKYEIKRPRELPFVFLCGYLIDIDKINLPRKDLENICDNVFHRGISYNDLNKIGFDCAHGRDATRVEDIGWGDTYRDITYVKDILEQTIDTIINTIKEQK